MSEASTIEASHYRPVGKHRYGLQLIGLVLVSAILGLTADRLFGSRASDVSWLGISLILIVQASRMILVPQRFRESAFSGPRLRTLRLAGIALLIFYSVMATLKFQNLFFPE